MKNTRRTAAHAGGALLRPPHIVFSTDALRPVDRFRVFAEVMASSGFEFNTTSPLDFEVAMEMLPLRRLDISVCKKLTTDLTGDVSAAQAAKAPRRLGVQLCHQGRLHGRQHGTEAIAAPGEALVVRSHLQGSVTNAAGSKLHSIIIDEDLLAPLLKSELPTSAWRIPASNGALALLSTWLRAISDAEVALDENLKLFIESCVLDLVVLALDARDDAREEAEARSGKVARRQAILGLIAARSVQALSAEEVGASLGVSGRYVRQLLEETGKTFSEHLIEHRLQQAFKMLNDARYNDRKISEIAMQVGFNDISHFNRTFRRRFGDTPQGVRSGEQRE